MPLAAGQTVLFIGDSVTHAHRRPEELHDCYQLGSGYVNSAAGELAADHPRASWRFVNRGVCGDTVGRLAERWDADCLSLAPAVVSVLIGINDALANTRADRFADDLRRLLDLTRQRLPAARLFVLEPFGVGVDPHSTIDVISRDQLARLAGLQPVVRELAGPAFVPLQHLFDGAAMTLDGIHPSAAGHWRVARAWTAAARRAGLFPDGGVPR